MLEFQRVVLHYLEDTIEAGRGGQNERLTKGARTGRSHSGNGTGPKSKANPVQRNDQALIEGRQ
jgi:hypothetical protein